MPISVHHLLGRFPVLYERAILAGIAATEGAEVENRIVAFHASDDVLPEDLRWLAEQVEYLDVARRRGRWICGVASFVSGIRAAAAAPGRIGFFRGDTPPCLGARMATFWRRARLARLLARRKPDMLHAQFGHLALLALPVVRSLDIPLAASFRGQDVLLVRGASAENRTALFHYASTVLVRSADMQNDVSRLGCRQEKIVIHPTGVDVARVPFRERRPPVSESEAVILMAGRLVPKKGMSDALRAVALCRPSLNGPRVRIAGGGPELPALRRLVSELELEGRVEFLGKLPHEAVLQEMLEAHLFLLPCRTAPDGEKEGVPNALKEAQASGLPVLSTRHAGISECVEHGGGGLLAEEGDVDDIAANLDELLSHPERWGPMGRSGRKRIEALYDIGKLAAERIEIYRAVLGQMAAVSR